MTKTNQSAAASPRRMARMPGPADIGTPETPKLKAPSKLDLVENLLLASGGTSIAEIMEATGWQQHSVRGAIAGALKKRGIIVTSEKVDGTRRYQASRPQ